MISNAERVLEGLRRSIISGTLSPGARLNESTLSKEYGVSRVPVREAIRALETEGLVESKLYSGCRVSELPAEDAEELFAIREVLERSTARKAARRRVALDSVTEADISADSASVRWESWTAQREAIDGILREGDEALAEDRLELLPQLNISFHNAIAELSGSLSLVALLRTISSSIERLYVADVHQRARSSWPEHHLIIRAIDEGDAELAGTSMAKHIRRSKRSYLRGSSSAGA